MSGKNAHRRQVRHNKEFIAFLDVDSTEYLDWVVAVAFYAAVHLVEEHLAQFKMHSPSHEDRWRNMSLCKSLKPVFQDTRFLYDQSVACRYNCWTPPRAFVKSQVLPTLRTIERTLQKLRRSP